MRPNTLPVAYGHNCQRVANSYITRCLTPVIVSPLPIACPLSIAYMYRTLCLTRAIASPLPIAYTF